MARRAVLVGGAAALLGACGRGEGFVIPDLELPALPGLTRNGWDVPGFRPGEFRRGVVLLNMWASWCPHCAAEHEVLMRLSRERRVRMLGLVCRDRPEKALAVLRRTGNPYDAVALDEGRLSGPLRETAVPVSYVVDGTGRVVLKIRGALSDDVVATRVLPAVQAARTSGAAIG